MYNYIKCKYNLNLEQIYKEGLVDYDLTKLTFLCDSINKKVGEFLIRSNGELCHNITEYEKVNSNEIGSVGVIWNGTEYARVKNTEWVHLNFTGKIIIKTQLISKKTDADIKVEFEFKNGYVIKHTPNVLLIDNKDRLLHDKKIKELAIKNISKYNSKRYKIYEYFLKKPLIKLLHGVGYITSYIQDFVWFVEKKLNK